MFLEIFSLYLRSLLLATIFVVFVGIVWNFWRAIRKLDKTAKERQQFLYEVLMMSTMTIPIVSFALMAILLMLKA